MDDFVRQLFSDYVDKDRRLIVIGTNKPLPVRQYGAAREGDLYFLDLAGDGVGTYQPIFHIDMFITLVGPDDGGTMQALVGSPRLGTELLGTPFPYAMDEVYDSIAVHLEEVGMQVHRNPLVHRATRGRRLRMSELKQLAARRNDELLTNAIAELTAAGATDASSVDVRGWHHITWNNCLVEDSHLKTGRHVYLPTFGHGGNADLASVDAYMEQLWKRLGFEVTMLADFNKFARRQGVVHCIKKYLARAD